MKKFTIKDYAIFAACICIAIIAISYNEKIKAENQIYFPHPLSAQDIINYSNTDTHAVFVYPIFTQYAYQNQGFYDYYGKKCDSSCLSIKINPNDINATYVTGQGSYKFLTQLGYHSITDIDIDKNPDILKSYDKIILLHNEYMTKKEFDAISSHKNVIYLYPNSAYAQVSYDYKTNIEKLVYGHGYDGDEMNNTITNGFGFVTSSNNEYDLNCKNYKWEQMPNGIQITCFPEFLIQSDRHLLQTIKDYPTIQPSIIPRDNKVAISSLPFCDQYGNCKQK